MMTIMIKDNDDKIVVIVTVTIIGMMMVNDNPKNIETGNDCYNNDD